MSQIDWVDLATFIPIPILVLLGSWLFQRQWRMRLSAAVDLFVFLMSFDISMLVWYQAGSVRVNPVFVGAYRPIFGVLAALSFVLLAFSQRVQGAIFDRPRPKDYYPLWRVSICWLFALSGIAFRMYALLGGVPWFKR
jgi:hypothetical protein